MSTKYRAKSSTQLSTFGNGRTQDFHPCKKKIPFHLPGPAHYNHVYTISHANRSFAKASSEEGYTFSKGPRDIQRRRYTEKEPPGAGTYDPTLPKSGTSKPFLGGPERKADKHNGVPSPGKHSPKFPKEAPSWTLGDAETKVKDKTLAWAKLGPGTYDPVHLAHCKRYAPFAMTSKTGKGCAVDDGSELAVRIRNVQKKKQ